MVERFLAIILALMAAIFSTDMASDRDLEEEEKGSYYKYTKEPQVLLYRKKMILKLH